MTTKFILGATAVMTLAGLAILKCALDAADKALGDSAEMDRAIEQDGFITIWPPILHATANTSGGQQDHG